MEPAGAQTDTNQLARREQARELGAGLVLAVYRLLKISQLHSVDNMAVVQQMEQANDIIRSFAERTDARVSILFAKSTVFVAGQLLKGSRGDYDAALELGEMLRKFRFSEITFSHEVTVEDLTALLTAYSRASKDEGAREALRRPAPGIRLRYVSAAALDDAEDDLSPEEEVVRAYASAIVVMRRVFDNLAEGDYQLPHEAKRIAQKLVGLSEGDTPAFLGVTAMRNANHDAAGRAVNTSILAVTMARLVTKDLAILSRVAMAALLYDVGKPVILELQSLGPHSHLMQHLGPDDEQRLPAATVLALTAMGKLHDASRIRSVLAFEAHWHQHAGELGPLYGGAREAGVASRIVATAHRFNELLTPDPGASSFRTPDSAIRTMRREAADDLDRGVMALLVGAVGIFPTGTAVALSTGEIAVVVQTSSHPAEYVNPVVRLFTGADGREVEPTDVDLAEDDDRQIARVLTEGLPPYIEEARQAILAAADAPSLPPELRGMRTTAPPGGETGFETAAPPEAASATVPPEADALATVQPAEFKPVQPDDVPPVEEAAPAPSPPPEAPASVPAAPVSEPVIQEAAAEEPDPKSIERWPTPPPGAVVMPTPGTETQAEPEVRAHHPAYEDSDSSSDEPPSSIVPVASRSFAAPAQVKDSMVPPGLASAATGSLRKTPAAHVFVYVLDNALTGTLVFHDPDGERYAVFVRHGGPARIWTSKRLAPLKTMLVVTGYMLESSFKKGDLAEVADDDAALEKLLLDEGLVDPLDLADALGEQLRQQMAHVFALPPDTTYAFYADRNLIAGRCGESLVQVPPLAALIQGIREQADDPRLDATLARLEDGVFRLHPEADVDGFDFTDPELKIVEILSQRPITLGELLATCDAEVLTPTIFALMITRSLDMGTPDAEPPVKTHDEDHSDVRAVTKPPEDDQAENA